MPIGSQYKRVKPRVAVRLNGDHPLAYGLVCQYACNEGTGATIYSSAIKQVSTPLTGSPAWSVGKYGPCLKLNGSAQYGIIPVTGTGLSGWSATGITLACVFRLTSAPPQHGRLLEKGANNEIAITFNDSGSDSKISIQTLGSNSPSVTSTAAMNDGKTHIALVSITAAPVPTFYVDGGVIGTGGGAPLSYTNDINIGRYGGGGFNFPGLIEGVWAWNRALSASEVRLHSADPFCMFQSRRHVMFGQAAVTGGPFPWFTDSALSGGLQELGLSC